MTLILRGCRFCMLAAGVGLLAGTPALGQLRIASWNVTTYSGGRITQIQTAVYGEFEGRSMSPDILIVQEVLSSAAMIEFRDALNSAAGSPGDWEASTYQNGSDCIMLYRTSKIDELGPPQIISQGGSYPDPPRHTLRYRVRPDGYSASAVILCIYASHMKAGTTSQDMERRLTEAERIRDNAELLSDDWQFVLAADLNMRSSSEAAYQELVGSQPNNDGRFYDPIASPGTWNNNPGYRFIHTQDPTSDMDDRYDQILISDNLDDGGGFEYIGNASVPFSTSTWDDANHSYRTYGNDGTSYGIRLRTTGNSMVGATIAQAIIDAGAGMGHVPVYLDLAVPAEVGSDEAIDFGPVPEAVFTQRTLCVWNDGDVDLWTADGIARLDYSLAIAGGFVGPSGAFEAYAGDLPNEHVITMLPSGLGPQSGSATITSNAPDQPSRVVPLTGHIYERGDVNCDDSVDFGDINPFVDAMLCVGDPDPAACWAALYPDCNFLIADMTRDTPPHVGFEDINPFVERLLP